MATKTGSGSSGKSGAIRAGRAFVELSADDAGLRSVLGRAKKLVLGFGKSLAKIGGVMAGLGGISLGAGLWKAIDKLKDVGKLENAARAFGITSEAASGLFGMLAQNGGEFKEDLEGLTQFNQRISDAVNGVGGATGEAARLFEGLSVSAKDLVGVPIDEQFYRVLGAIRELPQEMQLAKLSLIGGTDSMKKWLPLLTRSEEELRAQAKASELSTAELADAREATAAYTKATTALGIAYSRVAISIAPAITLIADRLTPIIELASKAIGENRRLVLGFVGGLVAISAMGTALVATGSALAIGAFAASGFVSAFIALKAVIVGVAAAWPLLLGIAGAAAAVGAAGYALYRFTAVGEATRTVVTRLGKAFEWFKGVATTAWRGISIALREGDLRGAASIALQTLKVLWAGIQVGGTKAWNSIKNVAVDTWHDLVGEAQKALVDVRTELQIFGTDMKQGLQTAIVDVSKFFIGNWKTALETVWDMMAELVKYHMEAFRKLAEIAVDTVSNPRRALAGIANSMVAGVGLSSPLLLGGIAAAGEVKAGQELAAEQGVAVARDLLREKQKELKAAIDANTEAKKKAGRDFREGELDEKIAKLNEEEAKLKAMVVEQERKAAQNRFNQIAIDAVKNIKGLAQRKDAAIARLASSLVTGQFGGQNLAAQFGARGSVEKKQLDELKGMNGKLGQIERKVGGLPVD